MWCGSWENRSRWWWPSPLASGQDAAEIVLPDLEPLAAVTDVEAAIADDAPLLWPDHGSNVARCVRGAVGRRRPGWLRRRRARPVREPARGPRPHGAERDRGRSRRRRRVHGVGLDAGAVRRARRSGRTARGAARTRCARSPRTWAAGSVRSCRSTPSTRRWRWRPRSWAARSAGWRPGRNRCWASRTGARRCSSSRSAPSATARSSGLRADLLADMGAYPIGAFLPTTTQEMLGGVYTIRDIACRGRSIVTNATPVAPYRGAGRPEAAALIERAIDLVAAELGMDAGGGSPQEPDPRRRVPVRDGFGNGVRHRRLRQGARRGAARSPAWTRSVPSRRRAERAAITWSSGSGVATYVEITSFMSKEFGAVEVRDDGTVTVQTGTSPHGQGHETAFAQIASAVLGVPFDVGAGGAQRHRRRPPRRRHVGVTLAAGRRLVGPRAQRRGRGEGPHARRSPARGRRGRPHRGRGWSGGRGRADRARSPGPSWRRPPPTRRGSRRGWRPGLRAEGVYREPASTFPFGDPHRGGRGRHARPATSGWCATSPWTTADGS